MEDEKFTLLLDIQILKEFRGAKKKKKQSINSTLNSYKRQELRNGRGFRIKYPA